MLPLSSYAEATMLIAELQLKALTPCAAISVPQLLD